MARSYYGTTGYQFPVVDFSPIGDLANVARSAGKELAVRDALSDLNSADPKSLDQAAARLLKLGAYDEATKLLGASTARISANQRGANEALWAQILRGGGLGQPKDTETLDVPPPVAPAPAAPASGPPPWPSPGPRSEAPGPQEDPTRIAQTLAPPPPQAPGPQTAALGGMGMGTPPLPGQAAVPPAPAPPPPEPQMAQALPPGLPQGMGGVPLQPYTQGAPIAPPGPRPEERRPPPPADPMAARKADFNEMIAARNRYISAPKGYEGRFREEYKAALNRVNDKEERDYLSYAADRYRENYQAQVEGRSDDVRPVLSRTDYKSDLAGRPARDAELIEYAKGIRTTGDASRTGLDVIGTMKAISQDPDFVSGAGVVSGQKAYQVAQNLIYAARAVGLDEKYIKPIEKLDLSRGAVLSEVFGSLSNRIVIAASGGHLGNNFSNTDREYMSQSYPGLQHSVAGNKVLLEIAEAKFNRDAAIADLADRYRKDNPRANTAELRQLIVAYGKENNIFKNKDGSKSQLALNVEAALKNPKDIPGKTGAAYEPGGAVADKAKGFEGAARGIYNYLTTSTPGPEYTNRNIESGMAAQQAAEQIGARPLPPLPSVSAPRGVVSGGMPLGAMSPPAPSQVPQRYTKDGKKGLLLPNGLFIELGE